MPNRSKSVGTKKGKHVQMKSKSLDAMIAGIPIPDAVFFFVGSNTLGGGGGMPDDEEMKCPYSRLCG
jgi:hypothetical protein